QIRDEDVFPRQAQFKKEAEASQSRSAGARGNQLDLLDVLGHDLQAVDDRRAHDNGGAVLVIVKHRDVHALAQFALDVEAVRRLDILEIDAAEGRLQRRDHVDQFVQVVLLVDLDIENVDAGELLEQHALAFHHRLGGQ